MSCIECSISCCPGGEQCRSFNWLHLCTWIAAEATIARCRCRWNYIYIFFYDYFWYCSACTCDWISLSESRCWAAVLSSTSSSFLSVPAKWMEFMCYIHIIIHYIISKSYFIQNRRQESALRSLYLYTGFGWLFGWTLSHFAVSVLQKI